MPRSRYRILEIPNPHFMTATVNNWLPLFTRPETVEILFESWRFLQQEGNFTLFGYVIMENHLHLIAASPRLAPTMQRFKSWTARRLIGYLEETHSRRMLELLALFKRTHKTGSTYQVWEEGNHPQFIESEAVMRQKMDYIHYNPVARGYVDRPEHWRYSSARNYLGQPGLIEVCREW
uniref:REP element-mobilizing transposase RayT n=1 Tax=Candidatus Kentrum sp. TUN TaxID=2126343 RepID=A0A451A0Q0_9GAMM|nr:MAG: REP element-mobilizing transposase RayT [Candidatus Kentron sp. TUN]VFK59602.1 MAG: REP element-mobilizing transposase RayT [Candidatus Kentron sp. TUN]